MLEGAARFRPCDRPASRAYIVAPMNLVSRTLPLVALPTLFLPPFRPTTGNNWSDLHKRFFMNKIVD